jgi:hypothetical protein
MTERIKEAMQSYPEDPAARGRALRSLVNEDQAAFVRASLPILQTDREATGYEELLKALAHCDQLVIELCDPASVGKEASREIARRIAQFDPQLDTKLALLLRGRKSNDASEIAAIERVLDLLEAASTGARIVPALALLMRDPNPRLRARAALLIGRRVRNSGIVEACLGHEDARVRANAIESFWGDNTASVRRSLQSAAKDSNNRVVGNALLGLYRQHDREAIEGILTMAADSRPAFRTTAAWTMGQTSDAVFLPALEKLARDLYASVRNNASKSMAQIRDNAHTQTTESPASQP